MSSNKGWLSFITPSTVSGLGLGLLLGWLFAQKRHKSGIVQQELLAPEIEPWEARNVDQSRSVRHFQEQVLTLTEEYDRLQARHNKVSIQTRDKERLTVYYALEPVLLQLPVLVSDLDNGVVVDSQMLAGLLGSIPQRLETLGLNQIGQVGEVVMFDPRLHTPLSTISTLQPGVLVTVAIPGFRYQDNVLTRAQVALVGDS